MGKFKGRGDETMNWFIKVFKSMIDRDYRTLQDREHTFIAGSSMGGLIELYAVLQYNQVFSRAAALAPSVWVAPVKLGKLAKEAELLPDTIIYMDYGSEEGDFRPQVIQKFSRILSTLMDRGVMALDGSFRELIARQAGETASIFYEYVDVQDTGKLVGKRSFDAYDFVKSGPESR